MTDIDCTTNSATGCTDCPAIPAIPGVAAYTVHTPVQGWTAGANSLSRLDGDVHTVFNVSATGAIVIGFKPAAPSDEPTDPLSVTPPELIPHGLLLRSQAGRLYVSVVESGIAKTPVFPRMADDTFEVRRVRGVVTYWQNTALIYTSVQRTVEPLMVSACLYLSGDAVA